MKPTPYINIPFVHPLPWPPIHSANVATCWLQLCSVSFLVGLVVFFLLLLLRLLIDLPCILCYFVTRIAWPMVGLFFVISSFIGSITLRRPGGFGGGWITLDIATMHSAETCGRTNIFALNLFKTLQWIYSLNKQQNWYVMHINKYLVTRISRNGSTLENITNIDMYIS